MCVRTDPARLAQSAHQAGRARARWPGLIWSGLCALLASCAVGPNFERPTPPVVEHYAFGGDPTATVNAHGSAQNFMLGRAVAADWWQLFSSPQLNELVAESLNGNPTLDAARANLRQSQDSLRSGYGIFYPQVALDASATRQRFAPIKFGESLPSSIFNLFTLSASVSYVLDLFGAERRAVEALGAQVDAQRASAQAAYLVLTSNVVNAVIAKAAYQAQIDATRGLIALQREQVSLAEVQVRAGTAPYSTVLSLQSQLSSYEATIPQLEQRLTQSDDLLATLSGHLPAESRPRDITLAQLTLPGSLPVSLPSQLVRQRPDILLAEASLHTASAEVGVATAALFPSITLSGAYSANSTTTAGLLSPQGRAWGVAGDVSAPLFEGGNLWFKRKAAIDGYEQARSLYRQTVLTAFAQVADTLRALEHDAAALRAQDEALRTAEQALHLVQINYAAGLATYLDVLNADTQYHQAQINDVQALALRYQDTVALFAALGGGWWNARGAPLTSSGAP
ncbi:MAG TPA: efflux transporter outer membrane subunit [Steroidobacteraceae bacterium]|nr:efflux transporter outer membrane subunit [Steroidobacteraceae bacterium]